MERISPGPFFRALMPDYQREATLVDIVYSNIDKLYDPKLHAFGDSTLDFITKKNDPKIIKSRNLLGTYKPTGPSINGIKQKYQDFNKLLSNYGLQSDFSGEEISDAEHFFVAAVLAMIPIMGTALSGLASLEWEEGKDSISSIYKAHKKIYQGYEIKQVLKTLGREFLSNGRQLLGPDYAGNAYGTIVALNNDPLIRHLL